LRRTKHQVPRTNKDTEGRMQRRWLLGLVLGTWYLVLGSPAGAQEVKWRYDYNAARKEAGEKGLPLVLDFGTDNCYWCKRLDATPSRAPAVVKAMNERFVPLKVDAQKEPQLTQILNIQGFPTLVLAAPDGKILGTLEGYVEAPRFYENLQRVL